MSTLISWIAFGAGALGLLTGATTALGAGTVTDCMSYGPGPGTLAAALAGGGNVEFACSGTIVVPQVAIAANTTTTLDATGRSVTLSGNNANRVLRVTSGASLTLINVTVANGRADDILDTGVYGGGILNEGTLTLLGSKVVNSAADSGGGIYNAPTGTLKAFGSVISGNVTIQPTCPAGYACGGASFDGGGIYNAAGDSSAGMVELTSTSVTGNTAQNTGGGIFNRVYCAPPTNPPLPDCVAVRNLKVRDSTIAGNSAGVGGGIISDRGAIDIINSTIANNSAGLSGGGITIVMAAGDESPLVRLEQSTVAGNKAGVCGGVCGGGYSVRGSVIANNTGINCSGWVIDGWYNLSSDGTCNFIQPSSRNNVNPLLLALGSYGGPTATMALSSSSPAIGKGGACALYLDQRGAARNDPNFGNPPVACDIGAFEYSTAKGVTSIAADFNKTAVLNPHVIWFTTSFKPTKTHHGAEYYLAASTITFSAGGVDYALRVPNAKVVFSSAVTAPTTTFYDSWFGDSWQTGWVTTVPAGFGKQVFLTGVPFQVPVGGLPSAIKAVAWNGTFYGNAAGSAVNWKWAAAVYSQFMNLPLDDLNDLRVKPVEGKVAGFAEKNLPGTPANFLAYVVAGARGGGGSSYTGGYSGSQSVTVLPRKLKD